MTVLGKLIATGTSVFELVMIALFVCIIATAFSEQIYRRDVRERLRLGVGQLFGELAMLRRARLTATVTVLARTNLLVLDAQDLHTLLQRGPRIVQRINNVVEKRDGGGAVTSKGDIVEKEIG